MDREKTSDEPGVQRRRRLGARRVALGLALLAGAMWGLWRDVAWIAQPFYVWACGGYLLAVDGFAAWRRGHSLFTTRRRFVFPLAVASVSSWFFLELLNLHLKNGYYVGVLTSGRPLLGAEFGVRAVADLRERDPRELHARLAQRFDDPPRLDMVRVGILASRQPGIVLGRTER